MLLWEIGNVSYCPLHLNVKTYLQLRLDQTDKEQERCKNAFLLCKVYNSLCCRMPSLLQKIKLEWLVNGGKIFVMMIQFKLICNYFTWCKRKSHMRTELLIPGYGIFRSFSLSLLLPFTSLCRLFNSVKFFFCCCSWHSVYPLVMEIWNNMRGAVWTGIKVTSHCLFLAIRFQILGFRSQSFLNGQCPIFYWPQLFSGSVGSS